MARKANDGHGSLQEGSSILVVAAHPDDEALGCGGAIARHTAAGDRVTTVFLSEGVTSRYKGAASQEATPEIAEREDAARRAAVVLGTAEPIFLRHPNLRLRQFPVLDLVKEIEEIVARLKPVQIYTHHGGDLNSDHRICHEVVMTACRPFGECPVKSIYGFEIPSSTEWSTPGIGLPYQPTRFIDIADYSKTKIAALACYQQEMRAFPHPRSNEAIEAAWRRYGSYCGLMAAEAFVVFREIVS